MTIVSRGGDRRVSASIVYRSIGAVAQPLLTCFSWTNGPRSDHYLILISPRLPTNHRRFRSGCSCCDNHDHAEVVRRCLSARVRLSQTLCESNWNATKYVRVRAHKCPPTDECPCAFARYSIAVVPATKKSVQHVLREHFSRGLDLDWREGTCRL